MHSTVKMRDTMCMRVVLMMLALVWSLGGLPTINAAPTRQADPASQCAEGVRLFKAGQITAALPLLEAGFAGREQATFMSSDNLGHCSLALGQLRDNTNDRDGALTAYTVALQAFRQDNDRAGEDQTLSRIGVVYYAQGQYEKALDAYQQALTIERALGDQAGEGVTLGNIGVVYYAQGQYEKALDIFQQALTIKRAVGDQAGEGGTLSNIGAVYDVQGQHAQALDAYQQALTIERALGDQAGEGVTLGNIGAVYEAQGQYTQALDAYQQALTIKRAVGDQAGEGITLHNIGLVYYDQGQYTQAIDTIRQALAITRNLGDRATEGEALSTIGKIYRAQGQYDKALDYYQQALTIERALGNQQGEGQTLNSIGAVDYAQGQYDKALDYYQQALTIERAVGDQQGEGQTLNSIGAVYDARGKHTQALDYYQQALTIERAVGDQQGEGDTLNNVGGVYSSQGQYEKALDYYQQALTIRRTVGDRAGESATFHNIGGVYSSQGQYEKALEAYQQALTIEHALGDRATEGTTLDGIGAVYQYQGQYEKALDAYQQALAVQRTLGQRANEGGTLNFIGAVYDAQGQHAQALDTYQQALAIMRDLGDRSGESVTMNNIGEVYREQGQYEKALAFYQQALTLERAQGERANEGGTLSNIGAVYYLQEQYAQALASDQEALMIRRAVGDRAGESISLNNIGDVYDAQGHYDKALDSYQQAMDVLEQVRATAGSEQGRAGFIRQYADLYTHAVVLAHQQGQDDRAFLTSERGRARAFLDSLATGTVHIDDQASQTLLAQEQETYAARLAAQEALAKARAASQSDPALVADLERQLTTAEQQHAAALQAIEQRGGQLAALVPGRTKSVLDRAAVQHLLAPQTTLVAYVVGDDQTLAFILTHDRFTTVALSVTRTDLVAQVQALRSFPNTTEPSPASAQQLYQWLITPLKPFLTTPHLAIVPHNVLHYLPFAALNDGSHFLIDDYTLTVLPSASSLPFIQQNSGRVPTAPLILGNPTTTDPQLRPLSFAAREAQAIGQLYGVAPLLGPQATARILRERAVQAGIVHLAAHGRYNPIDPLASTIVLAPDGSDDGQLTVSAVYGLNLHAADLVVLSACETQINELSEHNVVSTGDEVVGLTRAFIFAGTPSVLATLWSVDDQSTELLMERFYIHLHDGLGKAEALRQAQLDVRAQYPNPYYWAGFVLSGDGGTANATAGSIQSPLWLWLGVSGLMLLVVGIAGVIMLRCRSKRLNHQLDAQSGNHGSVPHDLQSLPASLAVDAQRITGDQVALPDLDDNTAAAPPDRR